MDVSANPHLATAARVAAGLAATLAAAANGLLWLFVSVWQCDESCAYPDAHEHYPSAATWHQVPGSWEWSALGAMGVIGFALAVAFAVAFAARKPRLATALAGAAAVVALAPWVVA